MGQPVDEKAEGARPLCHRSTRGGQEPALAGPSKRLAARVMTATMSKAKSLTLVGIAYVVAIAVGAAWLVWGVHTSRLWLDTLVADILATLVIFAFSRMYGNSSFYDAYWSVVPPVLLFYWWSQSGVQQLRCWLIAVVVVVWAIRLTAHWLYAFPG